MSLQFISTSEGSELLRLGSEALRMLRDNSQSPERLVDFLKVQAAEPFDDFSFRQDALSSL
jgi:hypothetical protein